MIIIKERKQGSVLKEANKMYLPDLVKLVGKKAGCMAEWISKSRLMTIETKSPAFCGFNSGRFYITGVNGPYVEFIAKTMALISVEEHDDGSPTDYIIDFSDGSRLFLNLI